MDRVHLDNNATTIVDPCVANSCAFLETLGAVVTFLPANADGIVIDEGTGLLFFIAELAAYCHEQGVLFHADAARDNGDVPAEVRSTAVDFLTFSGGKFCALKGVCGLFEGLFESVVRDKDDAIPPEWCGRSGRRIRGHHGKGSMKAAGACRCRRHRHLPP